MRKSRRLVIPLAVFALLAGGGVAAGLSQVANAQTEITTCPSSTTTPISCSISDASTTYSTTVNNPSSIQAVVTLDTGDTSSTPDQYVAVTYSVFCTQGADEATTTNTSSPALPAEQAIAVGAPVTDTLTLGEPEPDTCIVESLTATLEASTTSGFTTTTTGSFTMELEWTPQASTSTSAASEPEISGYDGKCLDDTGNSTADRTKIQIWTCNGDGAQDWTLSSNGELQHNGACANDKGFGGNNSKVIMWTCNGAANEVWTHESSGELVSSVTGHGLICLDDPGYSKSNGSQLIVYACHDGTNQRWSVTSS
jgi:hypothetical protein